MQKDEGIDRKIYYYDFTAFTEENLKNGVTEAEQEIVIKKAFQHIKKVNEKIEACKNDTERLQILKEIAFHTLVGDNIYIIVDDIPNKGNIKFRIVLCRSNALPYIEKNGKLSNMVSEVKGNFKVAEITHCVLFPDKMIMGAEFNFNGARPSSVVTYIPKVFPEITMITCSGKMRNDVFERLTENRGYSLFELGVRNTDEMKVLLRDQMGIFGAFFNNIDDFDTYEVVIKRRITQKKEGFKLPVSIEEIKNIVNENREDIKNFKVSQGAYKDCIDLLSDKLICKKVFAVTDSKVIDSNEMYATIVNYYNSVFGM
ncbi:hypothetical protein [Lacrimispora saccharolytica]|uniref:Uncharacterized protein n=1 Tax=Lacrimispora saccharolytica (strain ATCC 35040 / DSM 2544 / NRCC 2533 / WM1) TaxID=610130 RepID=D9R911_LACSW|nr:hypothetical protein [Lacrimispora saccharolytica]ADL03986.1 hypothetical protein Closa_1385 [[Clostridium] saccharolyticum WM1]QRV21710.1 hypothetical protein I6K70_09845 [Lacrimispora saccharolytica]